MLEKTLLDSTGTLYLKSVTSAPGVAAAAKVCWGGVSSNTGDRRKRKAREAIGHTSAWEIKIVYNKVNKGL